MPAGVVSRTTNDGLDVPEEPAARVGLGPGRLGSGEGVGPDVGAVGDGAPTPPDGVQRAVQSGIEDRTPVD